MKYPTKKGGKPVLGWDQYSKLHGRRTAGLAGRFRQLKGMEVTDKMRAGMLRESEARAKALASRGATKEVKIGVPSQVKKRIEGAVSDAPKAPKVGGRTKPGTTPRPEKNQPPGGWGTGNQPRVLPWEQRGLMPGGGLPPIDRVRELISKVPSRWRNQVKLGPAIRQSPEGKVTRLDRPKKRKGY